MRVKRRNEYRNPRDLKRHPNHVRVHPAKKVALLAKCIADIGPTIPIVVDEHGFVLAGWAIVLAAIEIGIKKMPVVVVTGLSEARKRAYLLFDNKITEHSTYDWPALANELQGLSELLAADGLDFELTGFNAAEFDDLAARILDQSSEPDETVPPVGKQAVTQTGDIWTFSNKHRLLCGDSRTADYERLMLGDVAAMCFSDPPYNLKISALVGRGRTKHRNFAMACGEMSSTDFSSFLTDGHNSAAQNLADGALCYVCMDWRHETEILAAGAKLFNNAPLALVVWAKPNPGQGTLYRSAHELIYVFRKGTASHQNNVQLGRYGRNRSNVWSYPGTNSFRQGRLADLAAHPTVKPIMLVADAIKDCTRRNDIVIDPFVGSGTTILAAERVGRRAYGIEIDPLYVDTAVRRWIATYKSDVVLEGSGQTFEEVAAIRMGGGMMARSQKGSPSKSSPRGGRNGRQPATASEAADEPDKAQTGTGYSQPPERHQWKKGQSGNRAGRKKGSKNKRTIIIELMEQKLGRKIEDISKLSRIEGMLLKGIQKALGGDTKAMAFILRRYDEAEALQSRAEPIPTEQDQIVYAALVDKIKHELSEAGQ